MNRWTTALWERLKLIAGVLFFRLALDVCYVSIVSPAYLEDFLLPLPTDFAAHQYALSFLPLLFVSLVVPRGKGNINGPIFQIVLMFVLIPLTSAFGLDQQRSFLPVIMTTVAVLIAVTFSAPMTLQVRIPILLGAGNLALAASILFVSIFLVWSYLSGAMTGFSLDVTEIYDYRRDQSAILDVGPMGHLNAWAQKVFALWLFCMALKSRRWILAVLTYFLFVYFFGITSARIHLLLPVLALVMWAIFYYDIRIHAGYFVVGSLLLLLAVILLILELEVYGALALRRALFVPASATFEWFEFFSVRSSVYWSDRVLAGLVITEYSGTSLPFFIGNYLAPDKDLSFNNGLVSSGYAHAGVFGVLLYAAIIGLILRFGNALVRRGVPVWVAAAILVGPMRTAWADSDLAPALLTHGLLVALLLLWLHGVPRKVPHVQGVRSAPSII